MTLYFLSQCYHAIPFPPQLFRRSNRTSSSLTWHFMWKEVDCDVTEGEGDVADGDDPVGPLDGGHDVFVGDGRRTIFNELIL